MGKKFFITIFCIVYFMALDVLAGTLIDNGDGTVSDLDAGIVWQQGESSEMDWESAMSYCENLSRAGKSDWRLPNINELQSIVDYSKYNPASDTSFFPDIHISMYWSSTTDSRDIQSVSGIHFILGQVQNMGKTDAHDNYTRCIRLGQ